jgi:steroid 5-alpha reductase family enzyme
MHVVFDTWLRCLPPMLALAFVAWVVCTRRRNVGLVDIFWPGFFVAAAVTCLWRSPSWPQPWTQPWTMEKLALAAVVVAWAVRLSAHLAARNWNAPEDRRYVAIRARNEPGFAWKSLYLVFGLQALLAWIIAAPLAAGFTAAARDTQDGAFGAPWIFGLGLALAGITIEALADAQLAAFKASERDHGAVLDTGLWRYSRHPNYFGESLVWWGVFAMAFRADCWWIVISPLLITWLLLKISGVPMLERDIALRRPAYRDYVARTPAFFPWIPGKRASAPARERAR